MRNRSLEAERGTFTKVLWLIGTAAVLPYVRGVSSLFVAEDFDVLLLSSLDFHLFWQMAFVRATRIKVVALFKDWLGYQIWGANPAGYHMLSLLFHLLCSLLVCYLGYLLLKDIRGSAIGGLIFAVYPRHHGAVLWLAASQFVLSTFFILAGLTLFVVYLRRCQLKYYLLSSTCVVLALFSHEIGILLPPLALLAELLWRWESGDPLCTVLRDLDMYKKYLPWLLALTIFLMLSFSGPRAFKVQVRELDPRLVVEAYHFLGIDVARVKESLAYLTYLMWPQIPLNTLDLNLGSIVLAGISVCALLVFLVKGKPAERFFLLWTIGALLPFIFFSPFGPTDRYFYLAAAGLALILGRLGLRVYHRLQRKAAKVLMVAILGLYVVSSVMLLQVRIAEWREAGEMARDIIEQVLDLHPQVPPRSRMFFVGLPGWHGQAYVFLGGGIGGAMRTVYEDLRLEVYRSVDPQLKAWLLSRQEGAPIPGEFVFLYKDGGRVL